MGLNLSPADEKACRYSCVYCQLGHQRTEPAAARFPTAIDIERELRDFRAETIDALVICGNGEPTLHPRFADVVDLIRRVRDERFAGRPIVCLTSGTELGRHDVVEALRLLDEVAVKLDAGRCATLRRIALASGPVCVDWLTWRIGALKDAVVQTCFFEGPITNASEEEVAAWVQAVRSARPRRVDVYTVDRPPPSSRIRPISPARIEQIASRLRQAASVLVRAIV